MKMSSGKQKLRPWLEDMISKGEIEGLRWMNPEKTKFRIPWKHGGKQDWSPESSRIFMEWAKHTGKYREGVDQTNYPTWKTRLRCAFNKAPDIEEVRAESQLNCHEPFRVYILKESKRTRTNSTKSNDAKGLKPSDREDAEKFEEGEEEEEEGGDGDGIRRQSDSSERKKSTSSMIPSMVEEMDLADDSSSADRHYSSDLDGILPVLEDDFPADVLQDIVQGMDCSYDETFPANQLTSSLDNDLKLEENQSFMPMLQTAESQLNFPRATDCFMKFETFYCHQLVDSFVHNLQLGLHIAVSGYATSVRLTNTNFPTVVENFLSQDVRTSYLPLSQSLLNSPTKEQLVDHLLTRSLTEGLLLWMNEDGDVFAYRFCRGAIFYSSEAETDGKSLKIPLNKEKPEFVKIFTNRNCFPTQPDNFSDGHLPPTSNDPIIYLCCGQPTDFQDVPQKALVYIKITPSVYQETQIQPSSIDNMADSHILSPFSITSSVDNCSYNQFGLESDIELQTCDD